MAKRIQILLALLALVVLGILAAIVYSWLTFQNWQKLPGGFWVLAATAVGGGWAVLANLKDVLEGFKALLQFPSLLAGRAEARRYRQGERAKTGKAPASVPAANEVLPKGSKGPDFRYNPNFVGRQADLIELGRLLVNEEKPQPVVISGTGGAGKTQLAVEFCYRYGNRFEGVHWIQANRPEDIESGIAACGMAMDFETWPDKLAEQVQVTLNAWQEKPKRLVVLDNLEEPEALRTWLARLGGVRVLVTARRESWPVALGVQLHPLPLLDRADSLKLLRTQAERLYQLPDECLDPIAERLDDLPLALELAGRYLACRERLTPEAYLDELAQVGGAVGHISQKEAGKNSATGHSGSLADTFMLSWQALDCEPADAEQVAVVQIAQLLFKMAGWCAPGNPIPLEVLREGVSSQPDADEDEEEQEQATAEEKADLSNANFGAANFGNGNFGNANFGAATFDLALQGLYDLGLLAKTPDGPLIPPLLADFAQTLQSENGKPRESEPGLAKLCASLAQAGNEANNTGLPATFLPLRAHIETAAHFAEINQVEQASLLWNSLGWYMDDIAEFQRAKNCYERALAIGEKAKGPEHPHVATYINNLGLVLKNLGDLEGAKACYERALAIGEKVYGPEHPNVAIRVNNLGGVLKDLGNLAGAKECLERALSIFTKFLPADHPNIRIARENLEGVNAQLAAQKKD